MFNWLMAMMLAAGAPTGQLTVKTPELTVLMDSSAGWTIRAVDYQDEKMILPLGGQGVVLFSGGKWYGSAMNKDEPEAVSALTVMVDGKEVAVTGAQTVAGSQIKVRKESLVGALKHTAETTFEQDHFVQRHTLSATEEVKAANLYAFIYSLSPKASQWVAQAVNGNLLKGEFAGDNSHKPGALCRWLAQYDATAQKGVVAYFPQTFPGPGAMINLWDTPSYHKLFAQPRSGVLAKDTEFDLTMVMAFFSAAPDAWEGQAAEVAAKLQQQTPASTVAAVTAPRIYGEGVPETGELTFKAGNYTLPLSAGQAWTIKALGYKDKWPGGVNGFYNTVMIPKDSNFWGTGHTEGGREIVNKLTLTVDGQAQPVKTEQTLTGNKLTLIKDSTIWKFRNHTEITLTPDYLLERTELEALEEVELKLLYYFMHCFVPSTTRYLALLPDGQEEEGELGASKGMKVNKDTVWVAQYEPRWQMGFLCYTPKVISGPGSASHIWDLDRYHKYYLRSNNVRSLKKGEKLDYTVIVKMVEGETGDWQATKTAAEALVKQFPRVP